jgi:STE24 endopeptidase
VIRVPRPPAPDPREEFSEDEIRACAAYAKPRQRWGLAALAVRLGLLAVLAASPAGRRAVARLAGLAGDAVPVTAALTLAVVVVAEALVLLPFGLRAWRQDARAGLSTQALGGFLGDWAKARAIGLVLTVVPLGALILAARGRPPGYPLSAALVALVLVVALSLLGPVVLEPLFNRFVSLPDGRLRSRVLELAAGMGVPVRDVLVADASRRTTKVNAYVSGLGRTRRVVVYDTLLRQPHFPAPQGEPTARPGGASLPTRRAETPRDSFLAGSRGSAAAAGTERAAEDEVLLVLAHELAHVRHRDVTLGTAGAAVAAGAAVLAADRLLGVPAVAEAFGVSGLGDPRAGACLLFLAALAGLLAAPVGSLVSRWSEARADWTALEVARDPEAAVALERRLALENRADLRPNRLLVTLFWSHPPTMARIAQARLWATATAGGREGMVGH